jgi:hypothetical protein
MTAKKTKPKTEEQLRQERSLRAFRRSALQFAACRYGQLFDRHHHEPDAEVLHQLNRAEVALEAAARAYAETFK